MRLYIPHCLIAKHCISKASRVLEWGPSMIVYLTRCTGRSTNAYNDITNPVLVGTYLSILLRKFSSQYAFIYSALPRSKKWYFKTYQGSRMGSFDVYQNSLQLGRLSTNAYNDITNPVLVVSDWYTVLVWCAGSLHSQLQYGSYYLLTVVSRVTLLQVRERDIDWTLDYIYRTQEIF